MTAEPDFTPAHEHEINSDNTVWVTEVVVGFGNAQLHSFIEPSSWPAGAVVVEGAVMNAPADAVVGTEVDAARLVPTPMRANLVMPWWMLADLAAEISVFRKRLPVDVRDQFDSRKSRTVVEFNRTLGKVAWQGGGWDVKS